MSADQIHSGGVDLAHVSRLQVADMIEDVGCLNCHLREAEDFFSNENAELGILSIEDALEMLKAIQTSIGNMSAVLVSYIDKGGKGGE